MKVILTLLLMVAISTTEIGQPSTALGLQSSNRGSTSRGGSSSRTVPAARNLAPSARAPITRGSDRDPTYRGSTTRGAQAQGNPNAGQGSTSRDPTISPSRNQGSATKGAQGGQRQITYFDIVMAIQNNESEINRLFSSLPIGFPEKQKEHLAKVDELKAKNEKLKSMLDMAAVQAYKNDPKNNVRAGQIIYQQMLHKMSPNDFETHFDPRGALEIAAVLLKSGLGTGEKPGEVRFQDVAYQAFRASYAIQDFSRAELMLNKIAEQDIKIRPAIYKTLSQTRERWQRELKIQRLEGITDDLPKVKFETTKGDFVVELFENHAPETVGNFIDLVEKKFYNDMTFFLVRPGEYAQTGCPNGDGSGDAGYQIPCECYREQIRHVFTGVLCMATNGRERDTGGSQFFISHQTNEKWDGRYTAFGRVKEGMDVVYKLQTVDKTQADPAEIEPSKIIKATVLWKRDHKYEGNQIRKTEPVGQTTETFEQSTEPFKQATEPVEQETSTEDFLNKLEEAAKAKAGG